MVIIITNLIIYKINTVVGDGFPDVPFTKIALKFLCGHGTPCPYVNVAIIPTLNYSISLQIITENKVKFKLK